MTIEELQKHRRQALEESRKKIAAMHASLDRDDGTPTMSVVFQSNEQFDGSTSISSESANTGSTPTVSRADESISITRALVTVKRQEI
jgi:hypothetical protein